MGFPDSAASRTPMSLIDRHIHRALISAAAPLRLRQLRLLESRLQWDETQIQEYQEDRLRAMLDYCWKHVPFYRQHWAQAIDHPNEIATAADLIRLPTLTKLQVREHASALYTTEKSVRSTEGRTGGSTGSPIIFRLTPEDEEMAWAQMYMGWRWAGWEPGDPFLVVGGESVGIGLRDRRSRKDWAMNRWVSSGSNLTLERTRELVKQPHFHRVRLIYGYPNAIRALCDFLAVLGERPQSLMGVVCTAEVMLPEVRARIHQVLGVRVLDQWGMNDGGMHACESEPGHGLHLSFHRGLLEIIDDAGQQIREPGRPGRAIASSLLNWAMPLIRYETGDVVHWRKERAPSVAQRCNWPTLGPIDGRAGDVLVSASGRVVAMPGLTLVMRWLEGLESYQFIRADSGKVLVRLKFTDAQAFDKARCERFLVERIGADFDWQVIDAPPELTANGKLLIIKRMAS